MQITIRGKRFSLRWVTRLTDGKGNQLAGDCDAPHTPSKTIRIVKGQTEHAEFDVLIHEMLHAGLWDIKEDAVEQLATDIARTLWRLGWRKTQ
jgi:hypothetical protein